ncbi:MAG: M23 family metallopeptidase [Clostridia bacterium]|nr:M23 family metallopeptidase [Clostridia bacterium]
MNKDFFDDYIDDDDDEEEQNDKPVKTLTKGFLTALAVCVVAIGAALWTTVSSVSSYLNPSVTVRQSSETDEDEPYVDVTSDLRVNAAVSGVKGDSDSESDSDEKVTFRCEPVKNKSIQYGYSEVPIYNDTLGDYRAHTGIDYEADVGDKVRAMGKGVVKDIYYDDLLGNVVVIDHGQGVESYTCGLAKTALVQAGEVVSAGDFLGTVYAIPGEAAQSAHVHVEVKEKGNFVDPHKFMTAARGD